MNNFFGLLLQWYIKKAILKFSWFLKKQSNALIPQSGTSNKIWEDYVQVSNWNVH